MPNLYIDAIQFSKNPSGEEWASLVGTMTRFMSTQLATATSLTLPAAGFGALLTSLNPFDPLYIFDGPNSEIVQASSAVSEYATSISLVAPLQFTHNAGVAWCTDGISGSLGEAIVSACGQMEQRTKQALFSTTYTGEILRHPSMRAALDNQGSLNLRPRHFPITAFTSLAIQTMQGTINTYDTTQAFIDGDRQEVALPVLVPVSAGGQQNTPYIISGAPVNRRTNAWMTLTYTAGFLPGALPAELVEAGCLLIADILAKRDNPMGADSIYLGDKRITATMRGDLTGDTLLAKRANRILDYYAVQPF